MQTLIQGKYEVLAKLKEGGMGALYKVRHTLLDEIRVIKFMRAAIEDDPDAQKRFHQEAKLATSLKHPNIAQVYDFSEDENRNFYMVMEFIDGVNFSEFLARGGPPHLLLTLDVMIQTLAALGYLHKRGIVHRDISPENIMLTQEGDDRVHVKLIDLGVAKQTSSEGMTQTGMFLGKLKYASPEQLGSLPKGEKLDGRGDLYALGCVLYAAATGVPPFEAESPQDYLMAHIMKPPRSFEETDPDGRIPPDVRAAILRALEKRRDDRYANSEAFAEALELCRESLLSSLSSREAIGDAAREVELLAAGHRDRNVRQSGVSDVQELVAKAFRSAQTPVPAKTPTGGFRGSDAPTALTPQPDRPPLATSDTQATVLEPRGATPEPAAPPASRRPLVIGLASAVVVLAIAAALLLRSRPEPSPPAAGNGTLLLTASPWGRVVRIHDEEKNVELPAAGASTPARLDLPPGRYRITLRWEGAHASGEGAVTVTIGEAAQVTAHANIPAFDVEKAISFYAP